jgi:uncharacterized protein (DUF697 family)
VVSWHAGILGEHSLRDCVRRPFCCRDPAHGVAIAMSKGESMEASISISLAEAELRARRRVHAWTVGAVAVGWIPGSMLALAAGDVELCREVAACFGVEHWSAESVSTAIGASLAGKVVAGEALSLIPVFGWAVKAAVAGGITKAVGEAIIAYFKARSPYT